MTSREDAEVINGEPICTYYGSMDQSIKPTHGVGYFVLDEYIKDSVRTMESDATKNLNKIINSFNKTMPAKVNAIESELKRVNKFLEKKVSFLTNEIKKSDDLIKELISENDLKVKEIPDKKSKNKTLRIKK